MLPRTLLPPARRALLGGYGRHRAAALAPFRTATTTTEATPSASIESVPTGANEEPAGKKGEVLQKGARRDPELYVLLAIMTGAFGLAGWYFGRKPTSASSESKVPLAAESMPWQTDSTGKYQYHPGGDPSKAPKDAPSALNTVIVPNVNLPKRMHDRWNKWGKDGY